MRMPGVESDLGWSPAPATSVSVSDDSPTPNQPASVLWSGTVSFTDIPSPGDFRIVVREYELINTDITGAAGGQPGQRLVYASILPFDFVNQGVAT
jgi:hypothetical protein